MHASTTGMETTRAVLLVLGLLCLTCLASGLSETKADQSGTFSVEDYSDWLENHTINVVNYVAEVGTDVAILSPISPPPIGMRWFSLNFDGELQPPVGREVGRVGSTKSEKFLETYNTSWQSVFTFDKLNRWLRIRKVHLGYDDLFRVFVGENGTGKTAGRGSEECQAFDVAITLMTFEKHECGFTSKPQNPKAGDTLILSCSVIVNGMWNASLIFRNDYDESEIIGETKTCGIQRSLGSKICSSVRVKAETDILAYSCRLKFSSKERHIPKSPMFLNSKWTTEFNKEVVCNLPKIYLEAIPSDVTLLCNNMPCEETVAVNDTVTCMAHGYPQPIFDLRIRNISPDIGNNSESQGVDYENRFFVDTDEEESDDGFGGDNTTDATAVEIKGHEDFRIGPTNVGHIEITCNVSNALGWGYNSLVLEVKLELEEDDTTKTAHSDVEAGAASGETTFGNMKRVYHKGKFPSHKMDLQCAALPCDAIINVGDMSYVYYRGSDGTYLRAISKTFKCSMSLTGAPSVGCNHVWSGQDLGPTLIRITTEWPFGTEIWELLSTVYADIYGICNLLCNYKPCVNNDIMKVGDKISIYVDDRVFDPKRFKVTVPGSSSDGSAWKWLYTLQEEDLGRKKIEFKLEDTNTATYSCNGATILVIPDWSDLNILCNYWLCLEDEIMKVGDKISLYTRHNEPYTWSVKLPNAPDAVNVDQWYYTLGATDVGRMRIEFRVNDDMVTRNIFVISDSFGDMNILCNSWPCLEDGIMKVGDKISVYVKCEEGDNTWGVNLPNNPSPFDVGTWIYTLDVTDVGRMTIKLIHSLGNDVEESMTRNIIVISDPLVGMDMQCNGKFCRDNEIMRFGDEISCYFEPKVMIDGMNFTLLIDNYLKVEGYPSMYVLREEDVGTKLVQCNSQGKDGTYQKTRTITVICEFRDEVVWKPVKTVYENTPYELKFRKDNITYKSGAIILCGDEPCDKPGRTIYVGTYVTCRLNDGQRAHFKFKVNRRLVTANMPVTLMEVSYQLIANDTGPSQAICSAYGIKVYYTTEVEVNFTVFKWPCKNVMPASAYVFEYGNAADEIDSYGSTESPEHGDAAGAIDVDQAESIDSGPAADNKGVPKWIDEMAAEKSGTAGDDKSKPSIGSARESFVLLQLVLAFIAAFVGLGQF